MAEQMTAGQLAGFADHTAQMLITAANAAHPGNPRKAAATAVMAALTLPGDLTAAQVAAGIRARYRAAQAPLQPDEHRAPNGVVVGAFGPHGADSQQAVLDYEITEGGR